jgi:hypothetical protein
MDIKEIRDKLLVGEVEFTIKGKTTYGKDEEGKWKDVPKVFTVTKGSDSIWSDWNGMNVNKWGPTCVTLYTFDILGKKSVGKINYKDITIINKK